ncbi:MAG TPA: molybdopterin cofactor-binding domain-containing protein [Pyrinomonadaceae bacterium]|nr:molybdopterin cofactor-binding domain-containing protein [Pyrinomonadaceae bacterium]
MIDEQTPIDEVEIERYELFESPNYSFNFDRRDFIKAFGLGIVFIVPATRLLAQQRGQGESGRGGGGQNLPNDIDAWIHIDEKGDVTVFTGKVEVGQNTRTTLTQSVADELHVPVESVHLVMGDTDLTPFDMGTFGSRSTPTMAPQLRKAAAAAREMLIAMAAEQLNVAPNDLRIVDARFLNHDKSKTLTLAEVAKGRKLVKVIPDNIAITQPKDWTIAGKPVAKVNAREMVTGKHRYVSDIKREGMLYGKIVRRATFNAALVSVDAKAAEAMPGVKVVTDGNFIGVVAPDQQTATRAANATAVDWKSAGQPSNKELFDVLRKPATNQRGGGGEGGGSGARPQGSIADGLAAADKKLEQTYTVQYIAHAPLEPRATVAEWNGDKLTVWTGTQRPFGVRTELAEAFHIPEDKVHVIMPDTGSGYGGKHTGECAVEAARLAKAAGKPVKLTWTREEEFTWAYFRPAGVIDIKSGVKDDGTITAWEFHNYNSGPAGIQIKYDIPNNDIRFHPSDSPLRQGSYRGLAATANHFAREVHIDELAHLVGIDPLQFRLHNIKDERLRDVLQAAAKGFGWGKSKPAANHGFGIACGFEKGGYIATCAEIAIDPPSDKEDKANRRVRIVRVVEAFECGAIVNPMHLKNQIEGAITMAIGGALFESIQFDNGKILNPHFAQYRVPRFSDLPRIEVVLVDRKDIPSAGAGETPIVGLAPAVSNAIFNATGVRLRSLPMVPRGLQST